MTIVNVNDASFEEEVLRSELPVLIDLYADWCQPCKQLAPVVESVARKLEGKLKVVKIDIDRSPMIAQSFRVQSIPMLVVIHQGQVVGHQLGVVDEPTLLRMLEPVIPTDSAELEPKELAALLREGRVLPVDIRDAGSFGRHHIPGAVHVAEDEIESRAEELVPADGRLRVLYHRTEDPARKAAESLTSKGVEVGFLKGGYLHWEADGFEVERGG
jgi:thioredoxin 1